MPHFSCCSAHGGKAVQSDAVKRVRPQTPGIGVTSRSVTKRGK
jgi:hypothetical protein